MMRLSVQRRMAFFLAFAFIFLGCCSQGRCDDENNQEFPLPIPLKREKEDCRLPADPDYLTFPRWSSYYEKDQKDYSLSVRSQIKRLPDIDSKTKELSLKNDPKAVEMLLTLTPNETSVPWFESWVRDEVNRTKDQPVWPMPELTLAKFQGLIILLYSGSEFMVFLHNYEKAISNLPDEVTWKDDLLRDVEDFTFAFSLEYETWNLYAEESELESFLAEPTMESLVRIFGGTIHIVFFNRAYDIVNRLPKSRFARKYESVIKDLSELLSDSTVRDWEEKNGEETVEATKTVLSLEEAYNVKQTFAFLRELVKEFGTRVKE